MIPPVGLGIQGNQGENIRHQGLILLASPVRGKVRPIGCCQIPGGAAIPGGIDTQGGQGQCYPLVIRIFIEAGSPLKSRIQIGQIGGLRLLGQGAPPRQSQYSPFATDGADDGIGDLGLQVTEDPGQGQIRVRAGHRKGIVRFQLLIGGLIGLIIYKIVGTPDL